MNRDSGYVFLTNMEATSWFSRSKDEAVALWDGDGFGEVCNPVDMWEVVTNNGARDPDEFSWGSAGRNWWSHIQGLQCPRLHAAH